MSVTATSGHSGHHGAGHRRRRRDSLEECRCPLPASLCGLVIGKGGQSIQEIERLSGAHVQKDNTESRVPEFEIFVIRGTRSKIMKAAKLIYQKAGIDNLIAKEAQDFWLECVELTYPELETQAYFVPATHINRVPLTKIPDADVHVLDRKSTTVDSPNVQETDMAIDAAVGRVVFSLHKMAETHKDEELHRCLNTDHITGVCIFSEQLSSPRAPWELTDDILWRLKKWWEACVISSGVDPFMTSDVYKTLVARSDINMNKRMLDGQGGKQSVDRMEGTTRLTSRQFNEEKENSSSTGSGILKESQSGLGQDVFNLTWDKLHTGASSQEKGGASVSTSDVPSLNETPDIPIKNLFPAKLEAFWVQWVLQTFLHLESQSYVWPEGIFQNGQPHNQALACRTETSSKPRASRPTAHAPGANTVFSSHNGLLPLRTALRRVLQCLWKLFHLNQEAVPGAVGGHEPTPADNRPCPFWDGDFDLLLIHRHLGLVVCDVRVAGDVLQQRRGSRTNGVHHRDVARVDVLHDVTCVLHDVVLQLDAAGGWLSRVVSDVAPGLRVIKIVALPNLHEDLLREDLSRCLEAEEDTEVSAHFLTSDHMFDKVPPNEINKSLTN
ncbi:hypothetical protein C0Q70_12558 [Pomacea canaliculata]|uniref:K Homology domain-containing protein n=1 Tax=Pomacea canaliculata TaxID=400727 RepID=A0A2T7P1W9_POMCA|nr:hypothetical protein C0Q70_12558 [Pomacea canaliculata]